MSFDEKTKREVWKRTVNQQVSNSRGSPVRGLDEAGNEIHYNRYDDKNSPFSWKIYLRVSVAEGGTNNIENLRVLHAAER